MIKRFILLFGLMILAGAVSAEPLVDGKVDAGKQKAAACAACHGPKGNMQSAQFPKLAGQGAPYIYEQLKLFKSGKRQNAIMAGQAAGLGDQDMKNVAAYFASQQTRPGAADATTAPAGATLYHGGKPDRDIPACSGCHGPSGLGNAAAKFPRLSGQSSQYIVKQLTAYRDGTRSGYHNATIMNGVARNLSDVDIKALASYVAGLAPAGQNAQNDNGALMQNAKSPAGAGKSQADGGKAGDASAEKSGAADAAAEEETGAAGGTQDKPESKPAQGTGGIDAGAAAAGDAAGANGTQTPATGITDEEDTGSGKQPADDNGQQKQSQQ